MNMDCLFPVVLKLQLVNRRLSLSRNELNLRIGAADFMNRLTAVQLYQQFSIFRDDQPRENGNACSAKAFQKHLNFPMMIHPYESENQRFFLILSQ